ncbi:TPA: hypothetical protein OW314_000516 [Pseudomonas aeruginosa]|uniref:hypothetical protein n=1 Tax=Pseudomonas aeruginosa TaxID=287 RepID=UPI001C3F09AD|nr:hypothetical protein [Pseudomonas aeruginosa]EKW7733874.1 hypothetical protein [Pseudomonas aeruginosa]MBV6198305.1 hypothetical protein [Pseudomonas aeruginosa]MDP5741659.1 hypothetical protein [Pseudomonas aeruginosa]HBN8190374.1 hypothetical protein [Pseudomonas aeruginosa]HCE6018668.1 hypothetical protein [Pseudomonas aeruginosa]
MNNYENFENQENDTTDPADEILSLLHNCGIENSIISTKETLTLLKHKSLEEIRPKELLEELKSKIINRALKPETIIDISIQNIRTNNVDDKYLRDLFLLANFYTALAELTFQNDRLMLSWRALSQANYLVGFLSGCISPITNTQPEASSQGGIAKNKKIQNSEKTIIKTFYRTAPSKGWKNPHQATRHIIENLSRTQRENLLLPSTTDSLEQYILDLIIKERLIE